MPLKTSEQIREEMSDLRANGQSIVDVAELEDRELTDEEQASFDQILAQVESLEESEQSALKREDFAAKHRQAAKLQNRLDRGELSVGTPDPADQLYDFKVPARAKAVRDNEVYANDKDAYIAGHAILGGIFKKEKSIEFLNSIGIWNTLTEGVSTAGGFTVPEEMQRSIQRLREERGIFPRYARNWPMASDNLFIPRDISDTTAYWVGEGAEITAADVTFGAAELTAKKLACLTKISTELDEDSVIDIGNYVTRSMAYVMADKLDSAGFLGDGGSTYGGITGLANALNSSAIIDAATGNDAANNLDLADFEDVIGALPDYPNMRPVWFMSKPVYVASWVRLMNALGGVMRSEISGDSGPEIMGYPVIFTHVLSKTTGTNASTIIAYFGDLSLAATMGTRRDVRTQVTMDRYFENDLIGVKCTERIGITVHEIGDTIRNRPILGLKTAA